MNNIVLKGICPKRKFVLIEVKCFLTELIFFGKGDKNENGRVASTENIPFFSNFYGYFHGVNHLGYLPSILQRAILSGHWLLSSEIVEFLTVRVFLREQLLSFNNGTCVANNIQYDYPHL